MPPGRSASAMPCIEARGLRKTFGATIALDGIDLSVEEGRILGIVGPNGAGKSTALHAILGLIAYQGDLKVLGRDPRTERDQLMRDVAFIVVSRGRIVLECSMEAFASRYLQVMVHSDRLAAARTLQPIHERQVFGRAVLLFEHLDAEELAALGDVRTPSIADVFVAVMGGAAGEPQGAAR